MNKLSSHLQAKFKGTKITNTIKTFSSENGIQVIYEVLTDSVIERNNEQKNLQQTTIIESVFVMLVVPDEDQQRIKTNVFEPTVATLKQVTNHKQGMAADTFLKNVVKNESILRSYLSDCLDGIDQASYTL